MPIALIIFYRAMKRSIKRRRLLSEEERSIIRSFQSELVFVPAKLEMRGKLRGDLHAAKKEGISPPSCGNVILQAFVGIKHVAQKLKETDEVRLA